MGELQQPSINPKEHNPQLNPFSLKSSNLDSNFLLLLLRLLHKFQQQALIWEKPTSNQIASKKPPKKKVKYIKQNSDYTKTNGEIRVERLNFLQIIPRKIDHQNLERRSKERKNHEALDEDENKFTKKNGRVLGDLVESLVNKMGLGQICYPC